MHSMDLNQLMNPFALFSNGNCRECLFTLQFGTLVPRVTVPKSLESSYMKSYILVVYIQTSSGL